MFSQEKTAPGRLYCGLSNCKGDFTRNRGGPFNKACIDKTKGYGFKLKEGWFRLDKRKKSFTMRVVRHRKMLLRELVDTPSLGVFKGVLDETLRNLMQRKTALSMAGVLN